MPDPLDPATAATPPPKLLLQHVHRHSGSGETSTKCPPPSIASVLLNRTLATEWAYRRAYATNADRTAALATWLDYYNTQRRHSALNGLQPISRLSPT